MNASDDQDARLARIQQSLDNAEGHMRRVRTRDSAAILVGLVASTLATIVAGVPAATQVFIIDGWQLTCAATAGLTGVAAIATGLRQQYGSSTRLVDTATLVAKLRALEFAVALDRIGADEADTEYQSLLEKYPDLLPSPVERRRPALRT